MIVLSDEDKKSLTEKVIEKAVELYDFTPDERSNDNLDWMVENGYMTKQDMEHKRGIRRRGSKSERI